jgi:hypothetical protein
MLAIVLGIATAALVFAAEKGVDNYVCARKAEARYDADEFDDDNDIFCEEAPPEEERYHGRVCPDLFGRIQKVQDERLAESIRQGQELEELQKPDIFRNIREESEETYVDIPEDVIDHVFKDVKPSEEPQEESTEEEKPAEEETPAPERDEKGRFIKKKEG